MPEREYFIALNAFSPFGWARAKLLINYFGSAKKVFEAPIGALLTTGLPDYLAKKFISYRGTFDANAFWQKIKAVDAAVVTINDITYPESLRAIDDAPPVLYIRGKLLKSDARSVAIVGSRRMTYYGRSVTKKLATGLARLGVTIISGLAFGVDVEAHKSALDVGGRCIAVLASGIDTITPRSNDWLGKLILKRGGAIISEYPPGVIPQKYFFPFRNRIISGLAKGVIVTEGLIKSGTIHTARHAANQGKVVFAVPGPITSPSSGAPHFLIKSGASLVTEVQDILDGLNLNSPTKSKLGY